MKILFVIHGVDNQVIAAAYKKKNKISECLGCMVDSCIYAEKKELNQLSLELLGGKIYTLEAENCFIDVIAYSLHDLVEKEGYRAVVVADGCMSGDLAVKLAKLLKVKCVTSVTELVYKKESVLCEKMVYNNLLSAKIEIPLEFVISERFAVENIANCYPDLLECVELNPCKRPEYLIDSVVVEERPLQMVAPVLIAVGMGVKSKEDLIKLREYAKNQGFSFGVSRPVAMRGWADINEIIGVSGKIYAPKITIAIGISGAAAFMIGIKQSSYILAINSNPDAVISKQSDAIIVDDYQNIVWALLEYLKDWTRGTKETREKDC